MAAILETDRLVLREYTVEDAQGFFELNSDPDVMRYLGDPWPRSVDEARQALLERPIADYARHGFGRLACVLKATGSVIGFCGLKHLEELGEVDLGYRFVKACWGRGLATEAARAVLADGFGRLRLDRVIGLVHPENRSSVRVLEKTGMTYIATISYFGSPTAKYALARPAEQV